MKGSVLILLLSTILTAQAAPEVEITAEPYHHLVFANDQIRVFNVDVLPHSETLTHWHRHDYVFVTLGAANIVNAVEGKEPAPLKLSVGETRFVPAPVAHIVRNVGAQPFRIITVEFLEDDKLRHSPSPWDEARGLDILNGGTKEILFVRDGVRVSEFELQPGGMVPHPDIGPQLLVAISDLEILNRGEGQRSQPSHFKSGDSKWFPGGYSQAVTNVGHKLAKYVILEFP